MKQMTWRGPDEVVDAVARSARQAGRSANEWVTLVLRAATDPDLADGDVLRVRERLRAAGLLEEQGPSPARPDPDEVAAARARAGRGRPLSDLVVEGREG